MSQIYLKLSDDGRNKKEFQCKILARCIRTFLHERLSCNLIYMPKEATIIWTSLKTALTRNYLIHEKF